MNYTEKNGCKISELTLGTVQLDMPYGINNIHGIPTRCYYRRYAGAENYERI